MDAAYFFGPWGIEIKYVETHRAGASRLVSQAHANLILTGNAAGVAATDVVGDASTLTEKYDFTGIALSVGYDVAPGLKWYGEVVHFDYDFTRAAAVAAGSANDLNLDNNGVALITGLVLSF